MESSDTRESFTFGDVLGELLQAGDAGTLPRSTNTAVFGLGARLAFPDHSRVKATFMAVLTQKFQLVVQVSHSVIPSVSVSDHLATMLRRSA